MRREKKKPASQSRSIRTLVLFLTIVGVLILASLSFRLVVLLQQSKFDGEHRFTILVKHDTRTATVLSFEPKEHSVSRVLVHDQEALSEVGKYLGIPIDGTLLDKTVIAEDTDLTAALFSYYAGLKRKEGGLTAIDLFRLWILSLSIQSKDVETKTLTAGLDAGEVDEEISEMFVDTDLANEKVSVEIVNATGVTGRGSRLERMISNMGIPVVQVTTATSPQDHSMIQYTDDSTYTFEKVSQLLGFPADALSERGLSDIIITVGRDAESHHLF